MIGYLSGRVIGILKNAIILKLPSGMGYVMQVSQDKRYMVNENLEFFIWEITRETGSELYAFKNLEDRDLAEKLTKVSGLGPKMAANIIYSLGSERVATAINSGDSDTLSTVKGLGPKTAKKIVLELKKDVTEFDLSISNDSTNQMVIDFTDTLSNLGYKRGDIVNTITKLKKVANWHEDDLIGTVKKGLEILGKR